MSKSVVVGIGVLGLGLFLSAFFFHGKEKVVVGKVNVLSPIVQTETVTSILPTMDVDRITPAPGQVILLNTEIDEMSVEIAIQGLEAARQRYKKAYLVITSPGGSVISGARLVAYIDGTDLEVHTVCSEICASMAFHIFEAGKVRYMVDKSFLMGHPAAGSLRGTFPEMTSLLTALNSYVDRMDMRIARRAGITYDSFMVKVLKNIWIESQDAIKTGLADKLIHMPYQQESNDVVNTNEILKKRGITLKTIKDIEIFKTIYDAK